MMEASEGPPGGTAGEVTKDELLWATLAHASYFVLGILGPLLVLLLHANIIGQESRFVRHHAKQALFWQIGAMLVALLTCGIGGLVMMIWAVLAALAANRGEWYTYPALGGVSAD